MRIIDAFHAWVDRVFDVIDAFHVWVDRVFDVIDRWLCSLADSNDPYR